MADKDKKKRHWPAILIVASCAFIFLISSMTYTVSNSEHVIVTRFGSFSKVAEPGLNFKMPYPIDAVVRIDKRLQLYEGPLTQTAISGLRNFLVATSASWKVGDKEGDAETFHKTLGSLTEAKSRMDDILGTSRSIFSEYSLKEIFKVSGDSEKNTIDEIRDRILKEAQKQGAQYGINVVYVGFTQLALPPDATKADLDRMKSERKLRAEQVTAEGKKEASRIENMAKQYASKTTGEAEIEAVTIRREGDKEALDVYKNFKNPELVAFLRQLESLPKLLKKRTQLVIDLNTPPFNLLRGEFFEELKKRAEKK